MAKLLVSERLEEKPWQDCKGFVLKSDPGLLQAFGGPGAGFGSAEAPGNLKNYRDRLTPLKSSFKGTVLHAVRYRACRGCYRTRGCAKAEPARSVWLKDPRGIGAARHGRPTWRVYKPYKSTVN